MGVHLRRPRGVRRVKIILVTILAVYVLIACAALYGLAVLARHAGTW